MRARLAVIGVLILFAVSVAFVLFVIRAARTQEPKGTPTASAKPRHITPVDLRTAFTKNSLDAQDDLNGQLVEFAANVQKSPDGNDKGWNISFLELSPDRGQPSFAITASFDNSSRSFARDLREGEGVMIVGKVRKIEKSVVRGLWDISIAGDSIKAQ